MILGVNRATPIYDNPFSQKDIIHVVVLSEGFESNVEIIGNGDRSIFG